MPALIDLAIAKKHLRLPDLTDTTEDDLIAIYIDAVEGHIATTIGAALPAPGAPSYGPLRSAALLYLSDLYDNRGANMELRGSNLVANPAAEMLIFPHRVNLGV